jgi:hypothetical protein
MWDLCTERLEPLACGIAGRNFNREEWKEYFSEEEYSPVCEGMPVPVDVTENELRRARELEGSSDINLVRKTYVPVCAWAGRASDRQSIAEIGRRGCIAGVADAVLPACERAVALEARRLDHCALLATARTLSGDSVRGLEDLSALITATRNVGQDELAGKYERWFHELQSGRNPLIRASGY